MLNRLFIVIGVLAILAIGAAFLVPRLIQWGQYRDRIESAASEALGTKVEIIGDIHFSLLPNPQLQFANVVVGPSEDPVLTIGNVDAELSLTDFLRDRYAITKLVLEKPRLDLKIGKDGRLTTGLNLASQVTDTSISVANARIAGGEVVVHDQRSDAIVRGQAIDGDLSLSALRGPFSFQGAGQFGAGRYSARLTTSALGKDGSTQITLAARPVEGGASLAVNGLLKTGEAPHFGGDFTYRKSPGAEALAAGAGDLVVSGKLEADADAVEVTDAALQPDENQLATRLTGSGSIDLGARPSFKAQVASGVIAQPPRDATKDEGPQPYEWVRSLAELPLPVVPSIPGTVNLDAGEVDLRAISLRSVHVEARSDGKNWTIDTAQGTLPGNSVAGLTGVLGVSAGKTRFDGAISLTTDRLDTLAALWRRPDEQNPLVGVPATFNGHLSLEGSTLAVTQGVLDFDKHQHAMTVVVGLVGTRSLDFTAHLGTLSRSDSDILLALVPDLRADPELAVTFPQGTLNLSADAATLAGLKGTALAAKAEWGPTGLHVTHIGAGDFGGAALDGTLSVAGNMSSPRFSGQATVSIADGQSPLVGYLAHAAGLPEQWRQLMARNAPANLHVRLNEPDADGAQTVGVNGQLGAAEVTASAELGAGVLKAATGHVNVALDLNAADPELLTGQLGLGPASVTPEGAPAHVVASLDGTLAKGFEAGFTVDGGGDSLAYDGTLTLADLERPAGSGAFKVKLSDPTVLVRQVAGDGLFLPALRAQANITFKGLDTVSMTRLSGSAAGADFAGDLSVQAQGDLRKVTGNLNLTGLDLPAVTATLAGPSSLIMTPDTLWPVGPLAIGDAPRPSTGDVAITAASLATGGPTPLTNAAFDFVWDQKSLRIKDFKGTMGDGTVAGDASVCCAGPEAGKAMEVRGSVTDVALADLAPSGLAAMMSGTLTSTFSVEGNGATFDDMLEGLGGTGTATVKNFAVDKFDPKAFEAVANVDDIVNVQPEDLSALVAVALDRGPFTSKEISASFTLANGVLRMANVAADAPGGHLFGSTQVKLADLGLDGSFALSPEGVVDPQGLISAATAKVTALISGTLLAPTRKLDLAALVDAIKVRAYELEVARLEKLKAEDDARSKAAQEAAARQAAEEAAAKKAAEEEAAKKAQEEAAKKAQEDAARKAAEDAAAASTAQDAIVQSPSFVQLPPIPAPNGTQQPLDLGIPPPEYQ